MRKINILFWVIALKRTLEAIRLIKGYVTFTATGGFPDRFLNSCRDNGVTLYNLSRTNGVIYADVNIADYRKMPRIRRNSDMKVRIYKKRGLPFAIHRRKNRVGLLIGFILFIITVMVLSQGIWSIRVDGNENIDEHDIVKAFEENGVSVGAYIKGIDISAAENNVATKLPSVNWLSLNISGGLAVINVREGVAIPNIKNENPPCNVVAKCGGQITTYEVYEGVGEQEVNAAVAKGDLLISGIRTYADGTTVLCPADGKIEAKTSQSFEAVVDDKFGLKRVGSIKKIYVINFFGMDFPIYTYNIFDDVKGRVLENESYMEINDVITPVGMTERNILILDSEPYKNTGRYMGICLDEYLKKQRLIVGESEIIKSDTKLQKSDEMMKLTGNFDLIEDISKKQEILYSE